MTPAQVAAMAAACWAHEHATEAHRLQYWRAADRLFDAWRELCEVAFEGRSPATLTDLAPSVLHVARLELAAAA